MFVVFRLYKVFMIYEKVENYLGCDNRESTQMFRCLEGQCISMVACFRLFIRSSKIWILQLIVVFVNGGFESGNVYVMEIKEDYPSKNKERSCPCHSATLTCIWQIHKGRYSNAKALLWVKGKASVCPDGG